MPFQIIKSVLYMTRNVHPDIFSIQRLDMLLPVGDQVQAEIPEVPKKKPHRRVTRKTKHTDQNGDSDQESEDFVESETDEEVEVIVVHPTREMNPNAREFHPRQEGGNQPVPQQAVPVEVEPQQPQVFQPRRSGRERHPPDRLQVSMARLRALQIFGRKYPKLGSLSQALWEICT